jgi:RNA polymerase sigma-70 factor, ECF subfamily
MPTTSPPPRRAPAAARSEGRLLAALRDGDERAFTELVERHGPAMKRLARTYVGSDAVAEEVVQETWLGVLAGIDRFQARSSVKTWIFRILTNSALTRATREARSRPFSALGHDEASEPAVDPSRFIDDSDPHLAGWWAADPGRWAAVPERRLLSREASERAFRAIERLPVTQREVIVLRDLEGWTSEEVCAALEITCANQRVLLHRARSRVRGELDEYLSD